MRRSWLSSQFYLTLIVGGLFIYFRYPETSYALNIIGSIYILSRVLTKKNRGQFYSGFITSEFFITLFLITWNFYFKPKWFVYFISGNVGLYAIGRGLTHQIGVKTQTIFR